MKKNYLSYVGIAALIGVAWLTVKITKTNKNISKDVQVSTEQFKEAKPIDILLLTALPGSGKSEVRRYLSSLSPEECKAQFGIGQTVQLDDFPYVHIMRRVSDELIARGHEGMFFRSLVLPFKDSRDWGTLTHLINEDYEDLVNKNKQNPQNVSKWIFDRIDAARNKVGIEPEFKKLPEELREELEVALKPDAENLLKEKNAEIVDDLSGKTVVIEFARGGAHGSQMPLPAPHGYAYTFAQFSPEILNKASILYIWVTPEEARHKNEVRSNPNDPGSILSHKVPLAVMYNDYGCDDIAYLLETSDIPNTVKVESNNKIYHLPLGRFDNRQDKTTFLRDDQSKWNIRNVNELKIALQKAFAPLVQN